MKLTRYKTFILSCYPQDDIIPDKDWELKRLRKLVYNPENAVVLNELKVRDGAKSYQVIKDDKLMIAVVFFFNTDQKIELNKTEFIALFKSLFFEVRKAQQIKFGNTKFNKKVNPVDIGLYKDFYKELNSSDDVYVWHWFNNKMNSNLKIDDNPNFIDYILKPFNITILQPRIPWKEQNLIWLKTEIENKEFIITEQGHLTVVNGVAYGSAETILNWRNILPKNSWKLVSDEPVPVRVRPVVVKVESVYDAEYMKEYYAKKADKYEMKKQIQNEANKHNMTFAEYRRQFYPNFTFRDEKIKFSIIRPQQGVPLIPVANTTPLFVPGTGHSVVPTKPVLNQVITTKPVLTPKQEQVKLKPKFEVKDLLKAYLTIPI